MKKYLLLSLTASFFISTGYSQSDAQNQFNPVGWPSNGINFTSFSKARTKITQELEALTSQELKSHPEYGVLPFNAPCKDCMELLQKRDASHRYFVKDGTNGKRFYAQSSYGDLNYKDENGLLRTIDPRISPEGHRDVFKAGHQPFPVTVNLAGKYTSILNAGKELQVNKNVSIYIKHKDGSITALGEPSWSDYTAGDNGVLVHNFYNGIDLQFDVREGKIESSYRLNKPLQLGDGWLVVHDNIKLPDGLIYDYSYAEKKEDNSYIGSLCINDHSGNRYFVISNPSAYDVNGSTGNRVNLPFLLSSDSYDLYVPIDWMNDAQRSYPLVIDPLVSATSTLPQPAITGSGYNATCFTGGCTYDLPVVVPPSCQITDIMYSFSYQSVFPCNLQDGGWDLSYGACRTPVNTCSIGLIGRCTLQGLDCFGTFQSCLPASQCATYNMDFTLTFYRCAGPGAGCGFSCINADSPWDVTVEGMSLDVTTADATVCEGTSATLTANASWGIPPYTYSWDNGAGNTQSVTVTPAVTTVYTVSVSDQCSPPPVTAPSTVTVKPAAVPDFSSGIDQTSDVDLTLSFTDLSNGAISWLWDFGDNSIDKSQNPVHTFPAAGTYTVMLTTTSGSGCVESITHTIEVTNTFFYYIPASFTPNGDGVNDYFAPIGTRNLIYDMTIYNRWGEEIFKTSNSSLPWSGESAISGKIAEAGVYVYTIKFKSSSYTDKLLVGSVTMLR